MALEDFGLIQMTAAARVLARRDDRSVPRASSHSRKVKRRGRDRVDAVFVLALAAYDWIRLPKLLAAPA